MQKRADYVSGSTTKLLYGHSCANSCSALISRLERDKHGMRKREAALIYWEWSAKYQEIGRKVHLNINLQNYNLMVHNYDLWKNNEI